MRVYTIIRRSAVTMGALFVLSAEATPIINITEYNSVGGTLVDFNSQAAGYYHSLDFASGALTITSPSGNGLRIFLDDNQLMGIKSSTPPTDNAAMNADSQHLTFTFANPISKFAFQFGNSTTTHYLKAYNTSNVLIETVAFGDPGNAGFIAGYSGMDYGSDAIKTMQLSGQVNSIINFDDFRFASAPVAAPLASMVSEPGSLGLAALALLGLATGCGKRNPINPRRT